MKLTIGPAKVSVSLGEYDITAAEKPIVKVDGLFGFGGFGVSARLNVPTVAWASLSFGKFGLVGAAEHHKPNPVTWRLAEVPVRVSPGEIGLKLFSGTVADGKMSFPKFGLTGSLEIPVAMSARIGFMRMAMASEVEVPNGIRGFTMFPNFGTDGEVFIPPFQATGRMRLPAFGAAGEITVPVALRTALAFPAFGLGGTLDLQIALQGTFGFAAFETFAEAYQVPSINGASVFPRFGTTGLLDSGVLTIKPGAMSFPTFTLVGEAELTVKASATVSFPAFSVSGRLRHGVQDLQMRNPYLMTGWQ